MLIVQDLTTRSKSYRSQTRPDQPQRAESTFKPGQIVMKFGEQLRSSVIKEYQWYYINYDELKEQLLGAPVDRPSKDNPKVRRRKWREEDETAFFARLEAELDKVYTKQKVKLSEIDRRLASAKREVDDVVARMNSRGPVGAENTDQDAPTEEEFMLLDEDLSDIAADVNDLAKFTQLNYTGFEKIIKKHDKETDWVLKPVFAASLAKKPFWKDNYDANIYKLSKLTDIVRTRGNPVKGDSAAGGSQGSFVRNTTKYWVHPDNITELKLIILKHLPVLVFNASKEFEQKDSAITSIYYDNPDTWELYEGRLKKTEGAEALRLRWYGGMDTETIFVERKTHREDWTGEKSVKARFAMKEKNVNAFMKGEFLPRDVFEKARKEGKKPAKQIDEDERLAREIQYSVLKRGYQPVCRSFYNRTAFQLPADARVRISLDTELTMVREDNMDGRRRSGDNWRRMDIGIDYPFSQLPAEDIERFPYAVLEVKLQTQHGQEAPEWVRELISSHLVEAVPKFSKFIHGTATMFPSRIHLLPFWMPQMDVDIRKPVTHRFGIQRPGQSLTASTSDDDFDDSDDENSDEDDSSASDTLAANDTNGRLRARRDRLETQDLERRARGGENLDIEEQFASHPLNDAYPLYDSDDEDVDEVEEARRVGGWTYYSALAKHHFAKLGEHTVSALHKITKPTTMPPSTGTMGALGSTEIQSKRFKAPKGKKIHVPVRVEPKVYFAAERTFLAWLEFSIYIGTIAATLLNFGAKPTRISFIAAGAFTIVAFLSLFYAVGVYLYRVDAIRNRKAIRYHDRIGPTVLCGALFIAVLINIIFEFKDRGIKL